MNVHIVEPHMPVPEELKLLLFKITDSDGKDLLCVGCYRPPSPGTALVDFLTENLDPIMIANQYDKVIIIGDINQGIIRDTFNTLLVVHNLHNYVSFPIYISRSSLDLVVTDLPPHTVQCLPLDFYGYLRLCGCVHQNMLQEAT